ncbi:inositol monophosphatase family protein [endosymbiont of Lamellibrachia barhami]|uniref:inositol monophosphatase family protein n=1 Tax=endosymbiont of Lamellibrachia barhami TaxID=205975 RepID=UPI0015B02D54|nr:inositol monophosphatase family protein [endosymbiont of Lamellibrachia barhami]
MIDKLRDHLDVLFQTLQELGRYQLERQSEAVAQVKTDDSMEDAWAANEVFSEVDIHTEQQLLAFCREEYGDYPVISEEFNAQNQPPADAEYTIVIDPLDGTKPYLEGSDGFGISFGVMQRGRFLFGVNFYPALESLYYAFADTDGVFDQNHQQIPTPTQWASECYLSLGFYDLLREEHRSPEQIQAALGVQVGNYPRSAIYIFKRILQGATFAYMSRGAFLWDIGPSSLLLEKVGCPLLDLHGEKVNFQELATPPFRHPAVVALSAGESSSFLTKLQSILASA